jgi:hypothetical protein
MYRLFLVARLGFLASMAVALVVIFVKGEPRTLKVSVFSALFLFAFIDALLSYTSPQLENRPHPESKTKLLLKLSPLSGDHATPTYKLFTAVMSLVGFMWCFSKAIGFL